MVRRPRTGWRGVMRRSCNHPVRASSSALPGSSQPDASGARRPGNVPREHGTRAHRSGVRELLHVQRALHGRGRGRHPRRGLAARRIRLGGGTNGHESVARGEAIKVQNDPYVLGDTLVNMDSNYLSALMANNAWEQNARVTNLGAAHTYVNGNWSGNTQYWMWNPATNRYELPAVSANI
jgi:hypothetical protein